MKRIDDVYENLKERVFQAEFKPNVLITEREIAEQYQVSRVTAGEALHRLCHDGHLTAYPRTGYMVTMLSGEEMRQIKRARLALESLVLDVLCEECSDEALRSLEHLIADDESSRANPSAVNRRFHMGMGLLTGDHYLVNALENLLGAASRVGQYVAPENLGSWQNCHREILETLYSRDSAAARECLMKDLDQR